MHTAEGYNIIATMSAESRLQQQEASWAGLMRAAQAGDARSYDELLRAVTPFIRNLARRYCRNGELAEDVVQDVLLTVHRVRHTWDPRRPFCPWLAAIAARRGIDRIRRASRIARHEVSDELAVETFAAPGANNESGALRAVEAIEPLLASLPQRQRLALEAVKIRGLSVAQAASESGQTETALKVNVHRAVKALRRLVAADRDGEA
ncbi:MAG: sigma-70 family RNA polymerase sigma factor [Gammaproteobacteria bacterium]|nr:sigma-70 family RNA polymerase sigma factor [Gammaproteobacteria bacterium]MDE2250402.1 sigma-70 family RNA polymerase sigma factor [Gammaproteobacteria bacterium]